MNIFSFEEVNLMCIYNTGTRQGLIAELEGMRRQLEAEETELLALTDSALEKLRGLTDEEFGQIELVPDFDVK